MTAAMKPAWTVGDAIRKARRAARMQQVELAEAVGVSHATISRWEADQSEPTITQYKRIAQETGADWLLAEIVTLFPYVDAFGYFEERELSQLRLFPQAPAFALRAV